MLTTALLNELKNYIKTNAGYAKFKGNGTYHTVSLVSAALDTRGRVIISFVIDHTFPADLTITEVQLYSSADVLWASKAENISRKQATEGLYCRFALTITES